MQPNARWASDFLALAQILDTKTRILGLPWAPFWRCARSWAGWSNRVAAAPSSTSVNSVNMAATDTPMIARAGALVAASMREAQGPQMGRIKTDSILSWTDPHHRPATVAEQISMMLFLLSDEASNLTGAIYATDGGWTGY